MTHDTQPPRVPDRDNATRTKARRRALDILFESDLRGRPASETLAERIGLNDPPVRPFTTALVNGVVAHAEELDRLLADALAAGWSIERLTRVDRNLARVALFEMAHTDTPAPVAISEAVDLAAELSTPESPSFLNAVLSTASSALAASGDPSPTTTD